MRYVGRFAPSPTGALHIGSLATAVASFIHARQAQGEWLVRIEDIDPPREVRGAADDILRALDALALHWDRSVSYQSASLTRYRQVAHELLDSRRAYRCECTRKRLQDLGGSAYPGICRGKQLENESLPIRVRVEAGAASFDDLFQGQVSGDVAADLGDYIVYRRDALPAYHLAVVVDDHAQGVTHIVRGRDLLPPTFAHLHLQRTLELPSPRYGHLPVLVNAQGQKLSKQTGATPVDPTKPGPLAFATLKLLGATPPRELEFDTPANLWAWARNHWRLETLKGRESIEV